jgi:hypothetical protein
MRMRTQGIGARERDAQENLARCVEASVTVRMLMRFDEVEQHETDEHSYDYDEQDTSLLLVLSSLVMALVVAGILVAKRS